MLLRLLLLSFLRLANDVYTLCKAWQNYSFLLIMQS